MTTRQHKVNSLLHREIAEYLRDHPLEELKGVVTITGVDTTDNLEYAKVFFSAIGAGPEEAVAALKAHIYEIQGAVNRHLAMRKLPRLSFVYDHSGEYAARIGKLIKGLRDDDHANSSKAV